MDDKVQRMLLIVVKAIRRSDLRESESLTRFVGFTLRRTMAAHIEQTVQNRRQDFDLEAGTTGSDRALRHEDQALVRQKAELLQPIPAAMSEKEKQILFRTFVKMQPPEQICHEIDLTEAEFRLLKLEAKAKFGAVANKRLVNSGASLDLGERSRFSSVTRLIGLFHLAEP